MKKRLLPLILAIMMVVAIFAGCGGSEDPATTTTAATTTAATTTAATTEATTTQATTAATTTAAPTTAATTPATTPDPFDLAYSADWDAEQWLAYEQQLDFGGRVFTIAADLGDRSPFAEDGTGDVRNDELSYEWYEMWCQIEEDLNIAIEIIDEIGDLDEFLPWLLAGDNVADVYNIKTHTWFPVYAKGALVKWNSDAMLANGLDINNEQFFYQPFTHAWDINGDTYGARMASKYVPPEAGWVMYFNKGLVASAGCEDLYEVVRNGEWTWDYFLELAGNVTKDNDGDGVNDTWGIATGYLGFGEEVLLNGGKFFDWVDGKLTCMIDSVEALDTYEFLDKVAESGYLCENLTGANATYKEGHQMFRDNQVGFLWSEMSRAVRGLSSSTALTGASMDWGTVPTPKANKDAEYMNILGGVKYDVMFTTNKEQDISAQIYAAFARRHNDVDVNSCLTRYLQYDEDLDSLDMLENYIFAKPVANWSWCSEEHNDTYRAEVVYKIFDETLAPSALVEANLPVLQNILDQLMGQ